jgi:hypothetical protein
MARSFNGAASDHIEWSGGPILYNQTAASIGCWFNHATMTASSGGCFLLDQQAAFNIRVEIFMGDGTVGVGLGKFFVGWRTPTAAANIAASANRWDDGLWHRLLLVRRNVTPFVELYVDGNSEGNSTTDPTTDSTTPAGNRWGDNFQGGDVAAFGSNGSGSLARGFLIAGAAISPNECDQILRTGVPTRHLDLYYEMGVGSPEPDWSGNGVAGTLSGTAVAPNGAWTVGWLKPTNRSIGFTPPSGKIPPPVWAAVQVL